MHIIIVGCGIGGLTCAIGLRKYGHNITILERASEVTAFGAGINISPNASRALRSLGVLDKILQHAYLPEYASMCSYKTTELLSRQFLGNLMWELYGAPFAVIHRHDLYRVLYEEACAAGVNVLFSHHVVVLNTTTSSVTVTGGARFTGDLIIGADGERSVCREAVLGRPVVLKDSGTHVFRFMIPKSRVANIPHLAHLVDPPCINLLVGPGGPTMMYCVKRGELFNVVLAMNHAGIESPPMLPHEVELSTIKKEFEGWALVQELLGFAERCIRWTLINSQTWERWFSNRTVLIGDACHIMTPFVGQGAAMAIEDAVVLSTLLGSFPNKSPDVLEHALKEFERMRHPRINFLQEKAATLYETYAYADGALQEERDQRLRSEMKVMEAREAGVLPKDMSSDFASDSPNFLSDVAFRDFIFEYDAEEIGKEAHSTLDSMYCDETNANESSLS